MVEENNLNQAIYSLRRALGDSANEPRFIMTLPGRGYRFVADVSIANPERRQASRKRSAMLGAAALGVIAVASWIFWPARETTAAPASVAVLPFKALLQDQSDPAPTMLNAERRARRRAGRTIPARCANAETTMPYGPRLEAAPALVNANGPHPHWGGRPQPLHMAIEGKNREAFDLLLAEGSRREWKQPAL